MRELTVKFFVLTIFSALVLAACGPKLSHYKTKQGFNVYCDGDCYSQHEVESAIDLTIDELVIRKGSPYTYAKVYEFLERADGWNDIHFLAEKKGPVGSCGTEKSPERACKGFECGTTSPSGWCSGLHTVRKICHNNANHCLEFSEVRVSNRSDCLAATALVHELLHLFQYYVEGFQDYYHEDEFFWPSACTEGDADDKKKCKRESLTNRINYNLCADFCGDLCKD